MRVFLFILLLIYGYPSQAIPIILHFPVSDSQTTRFNQMNNEAFQYNLEHLFYYVFPQQASKLHQLLGKNPRKKAMLEILKNPDKETREALAHLFFSNWYVTQLLGVDQLEGYPFNDIPWSPKIEKKIYELFANKERYSYEFYFISSLQNYYIQQSVLDPSQKAQLTQNFFELLRESKGKGFNSFDLIWAFFVLNPIYSESSDSKYPHYPWIEDVPIAKSFLSRLSHKNYLPARYFSALITLKEIRYQESGLILNDVDREIMERSKQSKLEKMVLHLQAIYELQPNHPAFFDVPKILAFIYQYYLKDEKSAQHFFRAFIDRPNNAHSSHFRPILLDSYLSTRDYSSAMQLAQEIIQDGKYYSEAYIAPYMIPVSLFISSMFYQGLGNVKKDRFKAKVWLEISWSIATKYEQVVLEALERVEDTISNQEAYKEALSGFIEQELLKIDYHLVKKYKETGKMPSLEDPKTNQVYGNRSSEGMQKMQKLLQELAFSKEQESNLIEIANFIKEQKLKINYEEDTRARSSTLSESEILRATRQARQQYEFMFSKPEASSCQVAFH